MDVRKIWDAAPHNAFTDLIRFRDRWFCAFREGRAHASPDGAIRILTSDDGRAWAPIALINSPIGDLRDPKLSTTPDGRLMLLAAAALQPPSKQRHQSLAWFSDDGRNWSEAVPIGDPNVWLWRITWHEGTAYGVGYSTADRKFTRLYKSRDGKSFETLIETLFERGHPNEAALTFLPNETALCLLRRDSGEATAQLGTARPPYIEWTWKDLGVRIGGPALVRLPDGRLIAGVRLYDGKVRTALCRCDPEAGRLIEILTLPSRGDTSYPGLVWHDGLLWVSYYSSHEGKASIYLARVKLPPR
ncbi:MAG: exo-alpha-sialidase [Isosphaeraceae bacterium]|nr:exo-alpha-sialidase [Isosphaeraceae bacterium]